MYLIKKLEILSLDNEMDSDLTLFITPHLFFWVWTGKD